MAVAVYIRKVSSSFPSVLSQNLKKDLDKIFSGDAEIFNAQLEAALPAGNNLCFIAIAS